MKEKCSTTKSVRTSAKATAEWQAELDGGLDAIGLERARPKSRRLRKIYDIARARVERELDAERKLARDVIAFARGIESLKEGGSARVSLAGVDMRVSRAGGKVTLTATAPAGPDTFSGLASSVTAALRERALHA